jgi:hypothetical protein
MKRLRKERKHTMDQIVSCSALTSLPIHSTALWHEVAHINKVHIYLVEASFEEIGISFASNVDRKD